MAKKVRRMAPNGMNYSQEDRTVAWRAIQKFNQMKPSLTQFARSITGNKKVEVHATSQGPYTERNNIFIRPPLALGRDYRHERNVCGSRGDDGRQVCAACRAREVVDFYMFHEIGHIWLGTQAEVKKSDTDLALEHVTEWHPSGACWHAETIMQRVRSSPEVMGIANAINQYLGAFVNALEDARINEGMFDARPGLRHIFDVNIERLMDEGVEHSLGEMKLWKDAPADAQFSVALSIQAYGYNISEWFHPDVVQALQTERLVEICRRAPYADSVHEIFMLAEEAFRIAQTLGFCIVPKCQVVPPMPQDDPSDKESDSEDSDGSGTGGSPSQGDPSPDAETSEGEADPSSGGSDGSGTGGTEGETSSSEDDGSSSTGNPVSGSSEPGGSSSGSDPKDDDAADTTESASGKGDHREEDLPGSSDAAKVDDGQSGDGGSESEDEGEPGVPATDRDGTGESPSDPSDDSEPEVSEPGEGVGGDGGTQDGTAEGRSDGSDVDGDDEEEDLLHSEDDSADDPWAVVAPDHDDIPDVITVPEHDPLPESGTIEDVNEALSPFLMHGMGQLEGMLEGMLGEGLESALADVETNSYDFQRVTDLIAIALSQVMYFDDPSMRVAGVDVATFPSPRIGWRKTDSWESIKPSELYLGQAVVHARRVFDDNKRTHLRPNTRSGKINARVLGKRAPLGDERLFGKKEVPKKKSHLVIITGDCSASTNSYNRNEKIKRMMFAQGEILHRVGVPFVMMGHSASNVQIKDFHTDKQEDYWMYILPIKGEHERWSDITRERLAAMNPVSENLDGHTLEYLRKIADRSQATDVTIIYYTDGEMPASNGTEEEAILRREIAICKRKGYHMLAVGINTSSPERFGMKTVRVDSDEDIKLVVKQLEEELVHI